ncbi:lymphotoxin-alpha [Halichoeres trimaculatus]|uniref:lymphotoxin-alpha n=1 Tax=Halichoeres trimaculatus TaxID=147232 RepID=UPI003D9DE2F4
MSKGKPCEHDMPLSEKQQMNLDTEGATHARMEPPSRPSQKYVLLQVWCGLLTVALVVMAAFLSSMKPKSAEGVVASQGSDYVIPAVETSVTPTNVSGSSASFIQLINRATIRVVFKFPAASSSAPWEAEHRSESCSLDLHDNSIHLTQPGLYFLYAQVTFSRLSRKNQTKSVILKKNPSSGTSVKKLVEGTFPRLTDCSVWVAKIVRLREGDSVSVDISDDFLTEMTFWGAYQLQ